MRISLQNLQRGIQDADQVEYQAVITGSTVSFEAGIEDERIAGNLVEESESSIEPEWHRRDVASEDHSSGLILELQRRKALLGDAYPFRIDKRSIQHMPSHTLAYEACLCITMSPSYSKKPLNSLPVNFELFSCKILELYLGPFSSGIRTGWPPHKDRPKRFKEVIDILHTRTEEFVWQSCPGWPDDPDPTHVKDGGLDFVAWKEMPDKRLGKIIVLGQCACGNDFMVKDNDVDITRLRDLYIRNSPTTEPLKTLCTPRHFPSDDLIWREMCRNAGFIMDRSRLTAIAEMPSNKDIVKQLFHADFTGVINTVSIALSASA